MAKRIIRTGTTADPTGDSLKNAFTKVNDNFTELYNALGLDADTLNLGAFEFSGSVNGVATITTTDSSAIVIDQATTVTSNLNVGGDILPSTNFGGNLGSPTQQWKSLYVSNSTVYLGGVPLSLEAGSNELRVNNVPISQNITYTDIPNAPVDISDLTDTGGLLGGNPSSLVNGANTVSLGSDGTLTLPGTGTIRTAFGAMSINAPTGSSNLSIKSSDTTTYMIVGNGSAGVTVGSYNWQFSNTGNLTFPNSTVQTTAYTGPQTTLVGATVAAVGGTASADETGITYSNKIAIFTEGAFTVGEWTDVQVGWTVTDNNGFTDTIASRGGFGAASFTSTVNNWPAPASGKTYVFTSPDYQPASVDPVEITVGNNDWTFGSDGDLTLPSEGKIYGIGLGAAGDRSGYISWDGDSSGDGLGWNTMRLVPDLQGLEDAHTYIILDPAYVDGETGSIHIRAGGTLDNSLANLCLGGANSHVQIGAGENPPVTVMANENSWTFGTDGDLTLPAGGIISLDGGDGSIGPVSDNLEITWDNEDLVLRSVAGSIEVEADNDVVIRTTYDSGTTAYLNEWVFQQDNELVNITGNSAVIAEEGNLTLQGGKNTIHSGNVNIVAVNNGVAVKTWEFGNSGAITTSGAFTIKTPGGTLIPSNYSGGGGWNQAYTNLATTGGSGTGLTVDVANGDGGYININSITINNPGSGYAAGDVITITNNLTLSGTFVLAPTPNTWDFGTDGTLTFPDDTEQTTAWTGILPNPTYSGSNAIGEATAAPLNLNNSAEATLLTQLNLINTGGGAGAGSAIDFWTYTSINDVPEVRLQAVDDGDYSADFAIKIKATGNSGEGSLTTSWTFGSDGTLAFPDATEQTTAFTTSPTLNVLKIDDGVHEKFQTKADATGTVTHDCADGHIFYHTSPDANWTANFTNLNLAATYATSVTLIITQGGTGYYPNAVQIGGSAQTINWQGNTTPTPSVNRKDVVTFSIICTATDTYTVLGQLTGF